MADATQDAINQIVDAILPLMEALQDAYGTFGARVCLERTLARIRQRATAQGMPNG
jgi:hypothetical protein